MMTALSRLKIFVFILAVFSVNLAQVLQAITILFWLDYISVVSIMKNCQFIIVGTGTSVFIKLSKQAAIMSCKQ